ncbi:zinc-finger of the MIZ type in Nse subunit-domain-containing protein, partial [Lophiotrema nucula]
SMASRNRISARPTPSRPSATAAPSRAARPNDVLPPYQKPSHPLDPAAQRKLANLYSRQTATNLQAHNKQAEDFITNAAALINDHLRDREERVDRRRKKWEKGVHAEEQEDEEASLDRFKDTVDEMTTKLEEGMRQVIDGRAAVERHEETMNWLSGHAPHAMLTEHQTQMTQRQSQARPQRRRRGEDEDMEDAEEDEGQPTPGPTPLTGERINLTGPSEMFADSLERRKTTYLNYSHYTRYAQNNAYVGFKKMVHDARYGDNAPALPRPETWFTERGEPQPGVTVTQNDADSDDDIVMDRETISRRCPITFQEFQEPYTSKKCPHSFEKNAVLQMIRQSNLRTQGVRAIECPVPGCSQTLSADDLHEDVILIRKIKRMQQAEDVEESEAEDESPKKKREEVDVEDSEMEDEPSRAGGFTRGRQQPPRSSTVVDLGDPSDEDD